MCPAKRLATSEQKTLSRLLWTRLTKAFFEKEGNGASSSSFSSCSSQTQKDSSPGGASYQVFGKPKGGLQKKSTNWPPLCPSLPGPVPQLNSFRFLPLLLPTCISRILCSYTPKNEFPVMSSQEKTKRKEKRFTRLFGRENGVLAWCSSRNEKP